MLPFRFFLPITASDFSLQSVTTIIRLLLPSSFVFLVLDKNKLQLVKELVFFAVRTGLEPATPGVTGRYSNQLNYRTIVQTYAFFSNADAKVRKKSESPNFLRTFLRFFVI